MNRLKVKALMRSIGFDDVGAAMVAALLVMVVLTVLGAGVITISTNNLENAGRDRIAGIAFGASEGGISQAIAFIRSNGLSTLTCDDPPVAGSDCSQLWGKNNPSVFTLSGGRVFKVWIQRIQRFNPPTFKVGTYMIHSNGTAGVGPASRSIDVRITVTPFNYPVGIYADEITDAGAPSLRKESMFSKKCISGREKITFVGDDQYWGIPSAAHSVQYVAEKVNSSCTRTEPENIHLEQPPATNPGVCNPTYPNDQDSLGGNLVGTSCYNPLGYPQTSFFDLQALRAFGYDQPRGLSDSQYAALKSMALEQGNYYTTTSFTPPPSPPPINNVVYYFNLKPGGGTLTVQGEFNGFSAATCGTRSIIVVVEGGDMHVNAGADIVGGVFVPDGNFRGNGDASVTGTLYARTIDKLNGTASFTLTNNTKPSCFFDNFPGGLMQITRVHFREVDR